MDAILDHIQNAVRSAAGNKTPLKIRGGGSKDFYGNPTYGELLDLKGYSGIVDYDPAELVITARCGTRLSEIEAALDEKGQMLAFEPPHFGLDATLGGAISSGLSGPRRAHAGAIRDFLLGVKILNGRGEILNFGGRVMKNVAGFDVSRLMAGSLGTLGIILEASIKTLPKPRAETSLSFEMDATTAIDKVNRWIANGHPITASCHIDNCLTLRFSASENRLAAIRKELGGEVFAMSKEFWNAIREQTHEFFASQPNLWRISVKSTTPPLKLNGKQLTEWNGSLRWYVGDAPTTSVRNSAQNARGYANLFRGKSDEGVFHPLPLLAFNLHKRLKKAFDPHFIFNPGRLYPGL